MREIYSATTDGVRETSLLRGAYVPPYRDDPGSNGGMPGVRSILRSNIEQRGRLLVHSLLVHSLLVHSLLVRNPYSLVSDSTWRQTIPGVRQYLESDSTGSQTILGSDCTVEPEGERHMLSKAWLGSYSADTMVQPGNPPLVREGGMVGARSSLRLTLIRQDSCRTSRGGTKLDEAI